MWSLHLSSDFPQQTKNLQDVLSQQQGKKLDEQESKARVFLESLLSV